MTSALSGGGWSTSHPGCPYPRERPSTHSVGGWVGPRVGQDKCGNFAPTGIRFLDLPAPSVVAIPTELSRPPHDTVLLCKPGELSVQTSVHGTRLRKMGIEDCEFIKLTVCIMSTHFCEQRVVSWHHWHCSKQAIGGNLFLDSPLSCLL